MSAARYELKFWASQVALSRFFSGLDCLVAADAHSEPTTGYVITSLYLDTPRFDMFHEKVEGLKNRTKVRLRRYGRTSAGFVELKAKRKRRIVKARQRVDGDELEAIARGDLSPLLAASRGGSAAATKLLGEFELRGELVPAVITRYDREAFFMRDDPAVRITIDRRLRAYGRELVETFLDPRVYDLSLLPMTQAAGREAILEVKSTDSVPPIVAEALRDAGLARQSISKYCLSVMSASSSPELDKERYRVCFPDSVA